MTNLLFIILKQSYYNTTNVYNTTIILQSLLESKILSK